jgi:hypothetical protein
MCLEDTGYEGVYCIELVQDVIWRRYFVNTVALAIRKRADF